VVNRRL